MDQALSAHSKAADGQAARTVWSLLETRYKSKGHLSFTYAMHIQRDEHSSTANYAIGLEPGPVYHLGLVRFDCGMRRYTPRRCINGT